MALTKEQLDKAQAIADAARAKDESPAAADTTGRLVTIVSKLPMSLVIEHGGKRRTIIGGNSEKAVGGHGLTHGVDADWFAAFAEANAEFKPIANGLMFDGGDRFKAADAAEERQGVVSGFEGIDTNKLPDGIEPAETPKE